MRYPEAKFEIVIDKGMIDAMVCGDGALGNVT